MDRVQRRGELREPYNKLAVREMLQGRRALTDEFAQRATGGILGHDTQLLLTLEAAAVCNDVRVGEPREDAHLCSG